MNSRTLSLMAALALPAMLVANACQDPKSNEQPPQTSTVGQDPKPKAQDSKSEGKPPPQTSVAGSALSPAALQVVERFEKVAPKVGDELPDVTVYDADGKEFKLRSLKGRYTVLVFGCLT